MTRVRNSVTATHKQHRIIIELLDEDKFIPNTRVLLTVYSPTNGLLYTHCNAGTIDTNLKMARDIITNPF